MADNKTIDNGALTDFTAATDEIGGVDYQRVKLVDGTDGSTAEIQGTAANGLEVDVTRIAASTTVLGKMHITDGTSDATVRNLASNDALNVAIVDGSGNHIVSMGGTGGTAIADDADFLAGTTQGTPAIGVYESSPSSVTDGDAGWIGIDQNRRIRVTVDASTIDVAHDAADSGNPVLVGQRGVSALPTAVTTADRTRAISDLFGRQLTAHIDPGMQTWKSFNATSAQTSIAVWTPTAGKKIAVTSVVIGTYGTTSGRVILYFSEGAYVEGTSQPLVKASFAPSSTAKPGLVETFNTPVYCTTADMDLRITTDAAISIDVTVYGYEF